MDLGTPDAFAQDTHLIRMTPGFLHVEQTHDIILATEKSVAAYWVEMLGILLFPNEKNHNLEAALSLLILDPSFLLE